VVSVATEHVLLGQYGAWDNENIKKKDAEETQKAECSIFFLRHFFQEVVISVLFTDMTIVTVSQMKRETPSTAQSVDELQTEVARTAIVCSIALASSFLLYALIRSGLDTPYFAMAILFLGFLAITLGPFFINNLFRPRVPLNDFNYIVLSISILVLFPLLLSSWLIPAYATLGIAALLFIAKSSQRGNIRLKSTEHFGVQLWRVSLTAALVLCSSFAAIAAKHSQQVADFFTPELAFLNLLHRDLVHHIAISNMSFLFGYPSSGLDGPGLLHYHGGAHYWFGALSDSLNLPTFHVLPIAHLLLISIFQFGFLFLSQRTFVLFRLRSSGSPLLLSLCALFFCDFLLFPGDAAVYYTSESLTFGLALLFLGVIAIQHLSKYENSKSISENKIIFLVLLTAIIPLVKVVVGFFSSGFLSIYFLFHRASVRVMLTWFISTAVIGVIALALLTPIFAILSGAYNPSHLHHPFRFRLAFQGSEITGGIATLLLIALVACLWKTRTKIIEAPGRRYLSSLALLLLVALIVGLGDWFNSLREYLYVSAGLLVLATMSALIAVFRSRIDCLVRTRYKSPGTPVYNRRVIIVALAALGLLVVYFIARDFENKSAIFTHRLKFAMVQIWDGSVGKSLISINAKDYFLDHIRENKKIFSSEIRENLNDSFWPSLIKIIEMHKEESGRSLAVHVPPGNTDFWHYDDVDTCTYKPLYVPALLNVPMIKGLPPEGTACEYVGLGHDFSSFSEESHSTTIDDSELCNYSLSRGIRRILILHNLTSPPKYRVLDC
jgi:hypothetical protein